MAQKQTKNKKTKTSTDKAYKFCSSIEDSTLRRRCIDERLRSSLESVSEKRMKQMREVNKRPFPKGSAIKKPKKTK